MVTISAQAFDWNIATAAEIDNIETWLIVG